MIGSHVAKEKHKGESRRSEISPPLGKASNLDEKFNSRSRGAANKAKLINFH
jgi:hypothetical protein